MSAIDKFRARYVGLGRLRIYVPELDLDIWSKPYTLLDEQELSQQVSDLNSPESFIALIIRKAEAEDGSRLFKPEDAPVLKRVGEASLLKSIALRIITSDTDGVDAAEKSEATP